MLSTCNINKHKWRIRRVTKEVCNNSGIQQKDFFEVCKRTLFGWKVAKMSPISIYDRHEEDGFHQYLKVEHTILPLLCVFTDYARAYEALVFLGYRHKYKGYTYCKCVKVTDESSGATTTHEYWYILEGGKVYHNDSESYVTYTERELFKHQTDVLDIIDKKTFKPKVIKKKWV